MANLPGCPGKWWWCGGIGETFGESFNGGIEHGIDVGVPQDSPVNVPLGGVVTDASYHPWGGQVGVLTNLPGIGTAVEYIQHLDLINNGIYPGASVSSGDLIGLSGGQLSGGFHPNDPTYSSGPHLEFGFNAPWIAGVDQASFKTNFDPSAILQQLKSGSLQASGAGVVTTGSSNTPSGGPGCDLSQVPWWAYVMCASQGENDTCLCASINSVNKIGNTVTNPLSLITDPSFWVRASLIVIGVVIILIGVHKLI